jgi:hypothetical protein
MENLLTRPSPQAAAQNGLQPGQPMPGPTPAHHRAGHQAVTVLTTEKVLTPVTAGRCQPTWASGLIPVLAPSRRVLRSPFASSQTPLPLLHSPLPTGLLTVVGHRKVIPTLSKSHASFAASPSSPTGQPHGEPPTNVPL